MTRPDEIDTLYNHASLLTSEGGQNREIALMLRAALAELTRLRERAESAEAGLSKQEAELYTLRGKLAEAEQRLAAVTSVARVCQLEAELADANERLRLCEVPDGWEAWRVKMEAKLAIARRWIANPDSPETDSEILSVLRSSEAQQ